MGGRRGSGGAGGVHTAVIDGRRSRGGRGGSENRSGDTMRVPTGSDDSQGQRSGSRLMKTIRSVRKGLSVVGWGTRNSLRKMAGGARALVRQRWWQILLVAGGLTAGVFTIRDMVNRTQDGIILTNQALNSGGTAGTPEGGENVSGSETSGEAQGSSADDTGSEGDETAVASGSVAPSAESGAGDSEENVQGSSEFAFAPGEEPAVSSGGGDGGVAGSLGTASAPGEESEGTPGSSGGGEDRPAEVLKETGDMRECVLDRTSEEALNVFCYGSPGAVRTSATISAPGGDVSKCGVRGCSVKVSVDYGEGKPDVDCTGEMQIPGSVGDTVSKKLKCVRSSGSSSGK